MIEQLSNTNTGSTGGPGFAYRSYERGYLNYPGGVISDVSTLEQMRRIGDAFIQRRRRGVTRMVARTLVTENALHDALSSPSLSGFIEAAVPTTYATRANSHHCSPIWMMIAAINDPSRKPLMPVNEMVESVDTSQRSHLQTPVDRIGQLRHAGYRFLRHIPRVRIPEVLALWKDSFEWDEIGVEKLHADLVCNLERTPRNRSVWFTGIVDPATDRMVALATAERLDMPVHEGNAMSVVESTEWRRSDTTNRHGLVAAAVSHINAQIIEDIGVLQPTIIAETNFRSGAHHVGFASGMDVPPRNIYGRNLPQMLIQNVRVGDGLQPEGTRDFTMMHLPQHSIQTLYDPASRQAMLKGGV